MSIAFSGHRPSRTAKRSEQRSEARDAASIQPTLGVHSDNVTPPKCAICAALTAAEVSAARCDHADRGDKQGINLELEVVHSALLSAGLAMFGEE
jgi:hypothetical protein